MATFSERVDAATESIEADVRSAIRTAIINFHEIVATAMVQYGSSRSERVALEDQLIRIGRKLGSAIHERTAAVESIFLLEDADELALENDDFLIFE